MNSATYTGHAQVEELVKAPEMGSDAWNCIEGQPGKEYYSKSPFATIIAYRKGFVVDNIVTGGKHPVPTWERATCLRGQIATRYQTIATRAGW